MIACRRMTRETVHHAFDLLNAFLSGDEHYLESAPAYGAGGKAALERALDLLAAKPELGFVWLAYDGDEPVAACVVSFAVSTSAGAVVAKMDDVTVRRDRLGHGIGTAHLAALKEELRRLGIKRIDTSVHFGNGDALRFYERHGFRTLEEERLACIL